VGRINEDMSGMSAVTQQRELKNFCNGISTEYTSVAFLGQGVAKSGDMQATEIILANGGSVGVSMGNSSEIVHNYNPQGNGIFSNGLWGFIEGVRSLDINTDAIQQPLPGFTPEQMNDLMACLQNFKNDINSPWISRFALANTDNQTNVALVNNTTATKYHAGGGVLLACPADEDIVSVAMASQADIGKASLSSIPVEKITVGEFHPMAKDRINGIKDQLEVLSKKEDQLTKPTPLTPEQAEKAKCEARGKELDAAREKYNKAVTDYEKNQPGMFDFAGKKAKAEEHQQLEKQHEELTKQIKENQVQLKAAEDKLKTPEAQAAIEQRDKQEKERLNELKTVAQEKTVLNTELNQVRALKSSAERLNPDQTITLQGDKNDPNLLVNNASAIKNQVKDIREMQVPNSRVSSR
jgi:hypothetical protein